MTKDSETVFTHKKQSVKRKPVFSELASTFQDDLLKSEKHMTNITKL